MQWLDSSWSEDLIKDLNLFHKLQSNVGETSGQFSDIGQYNFKIISEALVLVWLQSLHNSLQDHWILVGIEFVNDLILSS